MAVVKQCCIGIVLLTLCAVWTEVASSKLDDKVSQLMQWSMRVPLISLPSDKFSLYARNKPRNYSVVAMFTALKPARQCSVCREAFEEFEILANSYRQSSQFSSSLFFVMVDIDENGGDAFQALRITSAPTYFHFPASGKRQAEDTYSASRHGIGAEALSKWVTERTKIHIPIFRPPNYTLITVWFVAVVIGLVFAYWKRENLSTILDPKKWALLAMGVIFVMVSGQMWNQIRGPPFAHRHPQTGEVGYFSGSGQYQFVAETYIVMGLYAAMSFGLVLLNKETTLSLPPFVEKASCLIGLIIVVFVFSYQLAIFKMKYHGYPYKLFFG